MENINVVSCYSWDFFHLTSVGRLLWLGSRCLQVSRYYDSSILIFCGYRYFGKKNKFFGRYVDTSLLRYFSKLSLRP